MSKTGAVVLALIVGGAIGYYIGTRPKGDDGGGVPGVPANCLTPTTHLIDVSDLGAPDCPDVVLSKKDNNQIAWFSSAGSNLWVSIPGFNSNSSNNTARFVIPGTYTPNSTPSPIAYSIRVFGTGTPTPGPRTPTPPPQGNGRIIIMR